MANTYQIPADPSRLGLNAANTGAGNNELFLKQFAGEVLTTFEEQNVMMPLHMVRSISSGKSASFPVTGVASAKYHTPGESILAETGSTPSQATSGNYTVTFPSSNKYTTKFNHSERIITIDDMLVSAAFVANIDEAKNHYDVRSIYTTEIGRALAYVADKNLIRTVIAGATRTADRFGGSSTTYLGDTISYNDEATSATTPTLGEELVQAFFSAARKMDERNVPSNDRYAIVTPEVYYQLVAFSTDAINRDFNPEGNGSIAGGMIMSIAGIKIMKSNHIPTTNEASTAIAPHNDGGVQNDVFGGNGVGYGAFDFSRSKGVIFQREAVGTVKLLDLGVESEYQIERQGTLMVAKYAMGHGVLREECCFWLRGDA